jgi:hypothetical protein
MYICIYLPSLQEVGNFLNSNFTTSLAGALFGAWAGAAAAQRISERAKDREQQVAQIRATNAAIMSGFAIFNVIASLKNQQVRDLFTRFNTQLNELKMHQTGLAAGTVQPGTPFEFHADLLSLQMPLVPIESVKTLVYEKLSLNGRPLAAVSSLASSLDTLSLCISERNKLIEKFKNLGPSSPAALPALYFGLPYGGGHVSTEYADIIEAIHRNTDDAVFFSKQLCEDLEKYGNQILETHKKSNKHTKLKINSAIFTIAESKNLIPARAEYEEWLSTYQEHSPTEVTAKT